MATIIPNSLLLRALSFTILLPSSLAQDSPQSYVDAHNAARAQALIDPVVIVWDNEVANYSRQYSSERKNDCELLHSNGPYGENLAWSSGDMSGPDAVQLWFDEKPFYHYDSNSCDPGKVCGHYTQMVWKNSVKLGCAKVTCDNGLGTFITCHYDPPGNVVGEKPY